MKCTYISVLNETMNFDHIKPGLGNVRPAGHMRPAKHLNVAREHLFRLIRHKNAPSF